jgi:hypothetical protein
MRVEVPVLGMIEVPDDMSADEIMRIVGEYAGVDTTKPINDWDAFTRGLERGITGTTRGVGQVMSKVSGQERTAPSEDVQYDPMGVVTIGGTAPSEQEVRTGESVKQADIRKEFEYELAKIQGNKLASYGGYVAGTILDPANIITGLGTPTTKALAIEGIAAGGVQGFFDPIYGSEDTWGARTFGAAVGAGTGGLIGAGLGKLFNVDARAKTEADAGGFPSTEVKLGDEVDNVAPQTDVKDTLTSINTPNYTQNAVPGVQNQVELPKLPQYLGGAKPSFFKSGIEFETDLDKALYIIGNPMTKSKAGKEYLSFVKYSLNLNDDQAMALAKQVRQEVIDKGKEVQRVAGLSGQQATKIPFSMSKSLDNLINPVQKNLDDFSKMVYNYGQTVQEVNGKPKLTQAMNQDYSFKKIGEAYNAQGIKVSPEDVVYQVKGYQKMLDELKGLEGRNFKPKSFEEYVKGGMGHDEYIALLKNGAFDGCTL